MILYTRSYKYFLSGLITSKSYAHIPIWIHAKARLDFLAIILLYINIFEHVQCVRQHFYHLYLPNPNIIFTSRLFQSKSSAHMPSWIHAKVRLNFFALKLPLSFIYEDAHHIRNYFHCVYLPNLKNDVHPKQKLRSYA